jgi:hypothetical protein
MGRFDSRRSLKKKRRIGQAKKKDREERRAIAAELARHPGLAKTRIRIFISYSHHDRRQWVDRFMTMLKGMGVETFVDREIGSGVPWLDEIERNLAIAEGALLLVTADYAASDFIRGEEYPRILAEREQRRMRVHWVHISAAPYESMGLKERQAAYPPEPPLESLTRPKRNVAIKEICEKILDLAPISSPPARATVSRRGK